MSDATGPQTAQELHDALGELRDEPYGEARSARTEELVETAERLELDEARATAMLELLSAYEYGNEIRKAPVLFSRILKLYQDKPESFGDRERHSVFWCFKWISGALISLPEIPRASIEGWIEKMREHYAAAGEPLQAVRTSHYRLAAHTGVEAESAYDQWVTRPRDEFSDCEACEARTRGAFWAARGDDARALKEWAAVLEGDLECAEEPASTIAQALLPLVREGRQEEAVSLHRSGYRAAKHKVGMDSQVGRHLEFLALTGNSARGLELLAENRQRLGSTTDTLSGLAFLEGLRVLLTQLVAEGAADAPVTGPDGRSYTVASLLAEVTERSDKLARRFDERNGTTHQGDLHRARVERRPLTSEPLPLGIRVVPVAASLAPTAAPAAPAVPVPEEFATLLAEARAAAKDGKPSARALWNAVAERADEADLDDVLRAELAEQQADEHMAKQQWEQSEVLMRRAAELFDQAEQPGRATAVRSRAAWCALMGTEPASAQPWAELDALLATADSLLAAERIKPAHYAIVLHCRASTALRILMTADEESAAAARTRFDAENEAFRECAVRLDVLKRAAASEGMRCNVLMAAGERDQALAASEGAIAYAEKAGRPWLLPQYLAQHAQILNRLGRLEDAAPVLHRALALTAEWPDEDFNVVGVLMELAQNRLHSDDVATAITHLTSAATRFDRRGEPLPAADARAKLGNALLLSGRHADAVAVLESLITEESEAQLIERQRAQIRLDLGRALMRQDEPRAAAEIFAWLADFAADWDEQGPHMLAAGELACALYSARMWESGATAIERAMAVHEVAPNPAMVGRMLRTAAEAEYEGRDAEGVERALKLLDKADEVNEATLEVDGRYRRWPETALNADARVQALLCAKRPEEALAASECAIGSWLLGGDEAIGKYAGSALNAAIVEGDQLGRRTQAAARLTEAISRCRAAGHEQAVAVLTRQLKAFQG